MNFTGEIKRDLLRSVPEKRCCRCALLAAAADVCGSLDAGEDGHSGGIAFTSENEECASYLFRLVERSFEVEMSVTRAVYDPTKGREKLTFSYEGQDGGDIADEIAGARPDEDSNDCCAQAYLKGAFLFGGSCTLPREGTRTGYHLEAVFDEPDPTETFLALLDRFQIIGNLIARGEKFVVYLKSRESISDFLSLVGANGALKTLEAFSAEREESNNENRLLNCMAGNADKSAIASAAQAVAIAELLKRGKLDSLAPPLRETAEARIKYATLSLSELAAKLGVTKSCLNHRLRRLMALSRQ